MKSPAADWSVLASVLGSPAADIPLLLGEPDVQREGRSDLWLVFAESSRTLRLRCESSRSSGPTVASWSVSFAAGPATLREAAEPLGLWPACAPDEPAGRARGSLIRRAVRSADAGLVRSATATVRGGRIRTLAFFDEEPDWL